MPRSCTTTWSPRAARSPGRAGRPTSRGAWSCGAATSTRGSPSADLIVEREFRTPTVHQGYIEPHACVARYGEDGQILVWCSTQGQFIVRDCCAGHPRHRRRENQGDSERDRRRVRRQDSGLPRAARDRAVAQGRPPGEDGDDARRGVSRLRADLGHQGSDEDRRETRRHHRRGAARRSGTRRVPIAARRPAPARCAALRPYAIPNFFIEAYDVVVNQPKVAAYRAPGSPMATFATESLVDELARGSAWIRSSCG